MDEVPRPGAPGAGPECPFSPDGRHLKSAVPGRRDCQFCGASM